MNLLKDNYALLLCLLLVSHAVPSHAERADRDKPMNMEADSVTVDDANKISTFEGNVQMRQGTMLIEAGKIVVTQDKDGYSKITASGTPAHFRQKRDGVNEYADGYGERIVYDTLAETAEFLGSARVQREGDDVRGEHIIYNTKTGTFQVFGDKTSTTDKTSKPGKGRVTIVIQPKEAVKEASPGTQPTLPLSSPIITQPKP